MNSRAAMAKPTSHHQVDQAPLDVDRGSGPADRTTRARSARRHSRARPARAAPAASRTSRPQLPQRPVLGEQRRARRPPRGLPERQNRHGSLRLPTSITTSSRLPHPVSRHLRPPVSPTGPRLRLGKSYAPRARAMDIRSDEVAARAPAARRTMSWVSAIALVVDERSVGDVVGAGDCTACAMAARRDPKRPGDLRRGCPGMSPATGRRARGSVERWSC
jgi:hypothetical protein